MSGFKINDKPDRLRVILVNGPPRAGKDSFGAHLVARINDMGLGTAFRYKFATELKLSAHRLYGLDIGIYGEDYFEDTKDQPATEFRGQTPRNVYIAVSERLFKPLHTNRIYGELCRDWLLNWSNNFSGAKFAVITDSGFKPEAEVLIEAFGRENVMLCRIIRKGFGFGNDSRGYIELDLPEGHYFPIFNDFKREDLIASADHVIWEGPDAFWGTA